MSRKKTEEEYRRTPAYLFFKWLSGEDDPYVGNLEMKGQKPVEEPLEYAKERLKLKESLKEGLYSGVGELRSFKNARKIYRGVSVLFCAMLIMCLLLTVSWLPPLGTVERPINNEVSERYLERGLEETGAINLVSGMILDYRAFDTLGESHVLFTATMTVLILLKLSSAKKGQHIDERDEEEDKIYEPKEDPILQDCAKIVVPAIMIFGIYVILNGHLGPGGGFAGGSIIGAGLIVYVNAFGFERTERFFTEKTYKLISFCALAFYCLAKSYSFFTGANHIESIIPKGIPGNIISSGLILPLNIAVGLVVACTMYAFYAMFRKGDF